MIVFFYPYKLVRKKAKHFKNYIIYFKRFVSCKNVQAKAFKKAAHNLEKVLFGWFKRTHDAMNYAMKNFCFRSNQIKPIEILIEDSFWRIFALSSVNLQKFNLFILLYIQRVSFFPALEHFRNIVMQEEIRIQRTFFIYFSHSSPADAMRTIYNMNDCECDENMR